MKKIILSLGIVLTFISCKESPASHSVEDTKVEISFKKQGELEFLNAESNEVLKRIDIEIADNENKRARGLMDRSSMEENTGMLFIFNDNEVRPHTFYMKNTRFPLDIMYFDADSVLINKAVNARPGAEAEINGGTVAGAASDSKFVVEINGGLAQEWGLEDGKTKIRWNRN